MRDSDLPHRTKIREEILGKAAKVQDILKGKYKVGVVCDTSPSYIHVFCGGFQHLLGQISITLDAWTSKAYDPYLGVTAHYIDSPPQRPNEWTLKSDILGFTEIKGNHGGANQAATVLRVLDRYGIRDKVSLIYQTLLP
jgi:hypothetical protein